MVHQCNSDENHLFHSQHWKYVITPGWGGWELNPAVFIHCVFLTAGSSFIEKGSSTGHMRYLPSLSSQLNLSHYNVTAALSNFHMYYFDWGRERWIRLLFWSYNPAKLWRQSAEPLNQSESGSGCSNRPWHWLTAPGKEERWQRRGRTSCCAASASYGVIRASR